MTQNALLRSLRVTVRPSVLGCFSAAVSFTSVVVVFVTPSFLLPWRLALMFYIEENVLSAGVKCRAQALRMHLAYDTYNAHHSYG